jgi:hypothetical protein
VSALTPWSEFQGIQGGYFGCLKITTGFHKKICLTEEVRNKKLLTIGVPDYYKPELFSFTFPPTPR